MVGRTIAGTLAAAAIAAGVAAQGGRPMRIDDLMTAVRITEPDLSADGRLVAFVRTTTDFGTGRRNADIWVVPADGSSAPRPLIEGDKSELTPKWSPDGKRLAFMSTRDGSPQIYLANGDGSGVKAITNISGGVQSPIVFAPDGSRLAFVSDVYPECRDEACNKKKREDAEKNPVKARLLTRLLYRHWDEWREDIRHHVFVVTTDGGEARDVTPGDFDSPPFFAEDKAIAFSPDSRELAFVSNREGNDKEAWTTNNDVWVVSVTGGDAKKLTPGPAADVQPVFSPDGKTIFVRAQRRAGFESDRWYLDAYDRASGRKRTLFESPDVSVADFSLSPDGASVWFTAESAGREHLYMVPSGGGAPKLVVRGGAISAAQPARDAVVFSKSTLTSPADLFRASLDGSQIEPLTSANAGWLEDAQIQTPESRTAKGADGTPIQYWLLKPPNFDSSKKYPVVFLIHGGPQGAWLDGWSSRWNPSLWAAQGWIVAAPNPRGSTGFGQKFVDEISQDWGGKVMTDINAVFDDVVKLPFVDPAHQGIAGASYGGYAVNWIVGHTDRFKAAVTHDGVFNLESMTLSTEELWFTDWEFGGVPWSPKARQNLTKWSPHLFVQNVKTPTLIITNELDFRVPVDQGLQMFTALRRNGVPSQVLTFPDEGHWVLKALNSKRWHEEVFGWLRKYL